MPHIPSGNTILLDLIRFDDALAAAQRPVRIMTIKSGYMSPTSTRNTVTFWAHGEKSP